MKVPEQYRLKNHKLLGSDSSYGNNGFFVIPHQRITDYFYQCQVSDGGGWEHVSTSLIKQVKKIGKAYKNVFGTKDNPGGVHQYREEVYEYKAVERCPTWEEMCYIKKYFWGEDECVIEFHPPKSEYVSMHPYCLHLWRPTEVKIPMPDSIMVGIKAMA